MIKLIKKYWLLISIILCCSGAFYYDSIKNQNEFTGDVDSITPILEHWEP